MKVFSTNGYDGATMDEVANNAGVAKGTLYYHFKSKEEIFKFIIIQGMDVMTEQLELAVKQIDNPIDKLKTLCKVQLNLVYEKRDFFKVIMSQLWGQEIRQLELRDLIENYIKYIEGYIKEAMDCGVIKKGEASFMAYTFFGTLCSAAIYELINKDSDKLEVVIENLIQYILRGIESAEQPQQ